MALQDHLEKFRHFYEVARCGTFKEAAEHIAITQPSLTKSIQVLEGAIDKKLFTRQPRGVKLTVEGDLLYNYCHQLFAQLNDIEMRLAAPDDPMAGSLRVGTYDSIAVYFWPDFLREFLPENPHLSLELTTGRSKEIQTLVEQGQLDMGLTIEPKEGANVEVLNLWKDRFMLYASKELTPSYESLEEAPLIYMPQAFGGPKPDILKDYFQDKSKSKQRVEYHTSSLESVKELTIKGIGIGLLPTRVAQQDVEAKKLKLCPFGKFPKKGIAEHNVGVVYLRQHHQSKTLQSLIKELKNQGR